MAGWQGIAAIRPRASFRKDVEGGRPELSTGQVLAAVQGIDRHAGHRRRNGRPWSDTDLRTLEELRARAFDAVELGRMRYLPIPTWLSDELAVPAQDYKSGRLPAVKGTKLWHILSALIAAYRAGAVGLLLSGAEATSAFGGGVRTWQRNVRSLELAGLIEIVPTWRPKPNPDGTHQLRKRHRDRNLYQLGPRLLEHIGPGILEGLEGDGLPSKQWRARCAGGARKRARQFRRGVQGEAWEKLERHRQRPEETGTPPAPCPPVCHPTRPPETPLLTEGVGGPGRGPPGPASQAPQPEPGRAPPSGADSSRASPGPGVGEPELDLEACFAGDDAMRELIRGALADFASDRGSPANQEHEDGQTQLPRTRAGPVLRRRK